MQLTSTAFKHNSTIPTKYTCDGENINPPLQISDVPVQTKSFVLIMEDPDVPQEIRPEQLWIHWVVFNIPSDIKEIPENAEIGVSGKGDYPIFKYGGPCPPPQYQPTRHRYFFTVYALDCMLELVEGATKTEVLDTMKHHVLAQAELIGTYDRS